MKYGDIVKIKGHEGFFDFVTCRVIDIGYYPSQTQDTNDNIKVYTVEINKEFKRQFLETDLESYSSITKKDFDSLIGEKDV